MGATVHDLAPRKSLKNKDIHWRAAGESRSGVSRMNIRLVLRSPTTHPRVLVYYSESKGDGVFLEVMDPDTSGMKLHCPNQ